MGNMPFDLKCLAGPVDFRKKWCCGESARGTKNTQDYSFWPFFYLPLWVTIWFLDAYSMTGKEGLQKG